MERRHVTVGRAAVVASAMALLGAVLPNAAAADPISDQKAVVARVTDQLQALEQQSGALDEQYLAALNQKQQLDGQVAAAEQKIAAQQATVNALRDQLAEVAVQAYMGAGPGGGSPIFNTTAGVTDSLARDQLSRVATNSGAATNDEDVKALAAP